MEKNTIKNGYSFSSTLMIVFITISILTLFSLAYDLQQRHIYSERGGDSNGAKFAFSKKTKKSLNQVSPGHPCIVVVEAYLSEYQTDNIVNHSFTIFEANGGFKFGKRIKMPERSHFLRSPVFYDKTGFLNHSGFRLVERDYDFNIYLYKAIGYKSFDAIKVNKSNIDKVIIDFYRKNKDIRHIYISSLERISFLTGKSKSEDVIIKGDLYTMMDYTDEIESGLSLSEDGKYLLNRFELFPAKQKTIKIVKPILVKDGDAEYPDFTKLGENISKHSFQLNNSNDVVSYYNKYRCLDSGSYLDTVMKPNSLCIRKLPENKTTMLAINYPMLYKLKPGLNYAFPHRCWSPDGRNILFVGSMKQFGLSELFIVNIDSKKIKRLGNLQGDAGVFNPDLSWNRYGILVAYNKDILFYPSPDSSAIRIPIPGDVMKAAKARISPDGKKIMYFGQKKDGNYLIVANLRGKILFQTFVSKRDIRCLYGNWVDTGSWYEYDKVSIISNENDLFSCYNKNELRKFVGQFKTKAALKRINKAYGEFRKNAE